MENDNLLTLSADIGQYVVSATLTAPSSGHHRLAVLVFAHPAEWHLTDAERTDLTAFRTAAFAWATRLNGTTPLTIAPCHARVARRASQYAG